MLSRKTFLLFAFCICFTAHCHAASPIGIVTVSDGGAVFVRQTVKFTLKPGTQLEELDLIETGPQATLVRLEFFNGIQVNLGPKTRVMLTPKLGSGSKRRQAELYALNGWIKLTSVGDKEVALTVNLLSESIDISKIAGSAVISVQKNLHQVFSESGSLVITDRRLGKPLPSVTLNAGSYFVKTEGGKTTVNTPPPMSFVSIIPKAFLDNIPPLAGRYKVSRPPSARPIEDLVYKDALPWLSAEQDVKSLLVTTWKPYLNSGLRTSLISHIETHREWDRVLFPERYMPLKKIPGPAFN